MWWGSAPWGTRRTSPPGSTTSIGSWETAALVARGTRVSGAGGVGDVLRSSLRHQAKVLGFSPCSRA